MISFGWLDGARSDASVDRRVSGRPVDAITTEKRILEPYPTTPDRRKTLA
jgi:hypothetical protein